jgi:hypothetical protein
VEHNTKRNTTNLRPQNKPEHHQINCILKKEQKITKPNRPKQTKPNHLILSIYHFKNTFFKTKTKNSLFKNISLVCIFFTINCTNSRSLFTVFPSCGSLIFFLFVNYLAFLFLFSFFNDNYLAF